MAGAGNIGDCFVNKAGRGTPSHFWIVISDPTRDPDNVLIVNLTDAKKHHDASCVLTSGDHKWIKKESCVAYQWAKVTSVANLEQADSLGILDHQAALREDVLQRVLDGAYLSDELTGHQRELLRGQGLID